MHLHIIAPNHDTFLDQGRNLKPILILNQHLVLSTESTYDSTSHTIQEANFITYLNTHILYLIILCAQN